MKYILIILFWLTVISLAAQPVFEHTYNESASITQLESLGEVYYSMDVMNKQLLLYNMEHSLLKTVPLPTPEGYYLADIQYVSETLFNNDNLIEFVYTYSKYVSIDLSYYYTYESKVINENGLVLLTLEGVGYTEVIQTTQGKKFLAYDYDYSVIPYRTYTHVYSLPDQTVKSVSRSVSGFETGDAYPNPASRQVNIPVTLPGGVSSGTLEITDLNGMKILTYPVTRSDANVVVPASQLAPGTYLYQVRAGHSLSTVKKIVIR